MKIPCFFIVLALLFKPNEAQRGGGSEVVVQLSPLAQPVPLEKLPKNLSCTPDDRPASVLNNLSKGSFHQFVPPEPFACEKECGRWNGTATPPFLALVEKQTEKRALERIRCTGVLISKSHVISLASCLCSKTFCSIGRKFVVKGEDLKGDKHKVFLGGSEEWIPAARVDYYPEFTIDNPMLDLAVLTLDKKSDHSPICLPPPLIQTFSQGQGRDETLQLNWLDYNWDVDGVNDDISFSSTLNMCCGSQFQQENRGRWCYLPGRDINSFLNTANNFTKSAVRRHSVSRLMIASRKKDVVGGYPCVGMPYGPLDTVHKPCKDSACKERLDGVQCGEKDQEMTVCGTLKQRSLAVMHADLVELHKNDLGSCEVESGKTGFCRRDWCNDTARGASHYSLEIETIFGPGCQDQLRKVVGGGNFSPTKEMCGVLSHPFNFVIKDKENGKFLLANANEMNGTNPKRPNESWDPDVRAIKGMKELSTGVKGGVVTKSYQGAKGQLRYFLTGMATHGGILEGKKTAKKIFPFTIFRYIRFHEWVTAVSKIGKGSACQ